jgi:hypothetical protein
MTNPSNTRSHLRKSKDGFRKRARTESLELIGPTKSARQTLLIGVIVAAVGIAGIGLASALGTTLGHSNTTPSKQCTSVPTKMFDKETVPKYIIGPGYKVIPVKPTTTEVMVSSCG